MEKIAVEVKNLILWSSSEEKFRLKTVKEKMIKSKLKFKKTRAMRSQKSLKKPKLNSWMRF
jgi:hypothetical protein